MFDRDDEELIAHPELYALLPQRSFKDRVLCLYWQAGYRGTFSWSVFRDKQHYILRRLRTEPNEKTFQGLNIGVFGAEKIVPEKFAEAMQNKAQSIRAMKGGAVVIDGDHIILHLGPKPVVDFRNVERANPENKAALTSLMEELEAVFGNEISIGS